MKINYYYQEPMDWHQRVKFFTGRWYVREDDIGRQDLFVEAKVGWGGPKFVNSDFIWWEKIGDVQECGK